MPDIRHLVITHIHPDHYGLAGRLREITNADLSFHRLERLFIESRYVDADELLGEMREWLRMNGTPPDELDRLNRGSTSMMDRVQIAYPDRTLDGGEERGRLLQSEALTRPSCLSFGGIDEHSDVPSDEIPGLRVPYRPGQRVMPHGHCGTGITLSHSRQRQVHIPSGQFTQPSSADRRQDGSEDVLVLLDRLGRPSFKSLPQPVFGRAS